MPTVLLVDDDLGTRQTASAHLRLDGIDTLTASDGRAGIAAALSTECQLILVDLHLPDLSGVEVVRELKSRGIKCPMIIVTAFPRFDSSFEAARAGADGYVDGPLYADDLRQLIEGAFQGVLPVCNAKRQLDERATSRNDPQSDCHSRAVATTRDSIGNISFAAIAHPRCNSCDIRITAVVQAVEADPRVSLTRLATSVNLSVSRLRHLFADVTGHRLGRYRQTRRLDTAATLLRETHLRVSEIAAKVGLEPASLDKAFKERFGQPPKEYRSNYKIPPTV